MSDQPFHDQELVYIQLYGFESLEPEPCSLLKIPGEFLSIFCKLL